MADAQEMRLAVEDLPLVAVQECAGDDMLVAHNVLQISSSRREGAGPDDV